MGPGTVKTKKLFRKKLYSTLVQLESEVSGILKKNIKSDLIFSSLMPPGSVTGTPKSRSMEIINNLENHKRWKKTRAEKCSRAVCSILENLEHGINISRKKKATWKFGIFQV